MSPIVCIVPFNCATVGAYRSWVMNHHTRQKRSQLHCSARSSQERQWVCLRVGAPWAPPFATLGAHLQAQETLLSLQHEARSLKGQGQTKYIASTRLESTASTAQSNCIPWYCRSYKAGVARKTFRSTGGRRLQENTCCSKFGVQRLLRGTNIWLTMGAQYLMASLRSQSCCSSHHAIPKLSAAAAPQQPR